MESKSIVIHKGGKEEKYRLYVEDYVLSYLKYETGSLEFSEIYFYGTRQKEEKKYVIYGAGRDKQIPVFDTYDLLEEIVCRLTQAGPVFMVREGEEVYQIKGFDIFYQDNEAMQSYMVENKHSTARPRPAVKEDRHKTAPPPKPGIGKVETKALHSHGMMSAQLGVILIILVAIVINSANSYDKMEQLNQSAEEVFFAIENQEADDSVSSRYEPGAEIVVERGRDQEDDTENERETAEDTAEEESTQAGETEEIKGEESAQAGETEEIKGEESAQAGETEEIKGEESAQADGTEETKGKENVQADGAEDVETEDAEAENAEPPAEEGLLKPTSDNAQQDESDGEGTEALSRNVTRYYEVERGDTLYTICQKIYGDTSQVKKICELNDISDPDRIRSGQKIILP